MRRPIATKPQIASARNARPPRASATIPASTSELAGCSAGGGGSGSATTGAALSIGGAGSAAGSGSGVAAAGSQEEADDVEALNALLLAKQAETEQLHAEIAERKAIKDADDLKIANLTSIIPMLQRAQYGTRSEKLRIDPLNDDQYAFVFDELETGLSELSAGIEKRDGNPAARPPRPRKGFAPHLERVEVVIEPEVPAGREGLEKTRIGEM